MGRGVQKTEFQTTGVTSEGRTALGTPLDEGVAGRAFTEGGLGTEGCAMVVLCQGGRVDDLVEMIVAIGGG